MIGAAETLLGETSCIVIIKYLEDRCISMNGCLIETVLGPCPKQPISVWISYDQIHK